MLNFAYADISDLEKVKKLLLSCNLPNQDLVKEQLKDFIIAKDSGKIIGVVGLEVFNKVGLLRSLAVTAAYRRKGIAKELLKRIFAHAAMLKIKDVYLLTATIEQLCYKWGFVRIDRNNAPSAIRNTWEFKDACPKSAVCMHRNI